MSRECVCGRCNASYFNDRYAARRCAQCAEPVGTGIRPNALDTIRCGRCIGRQPAFDATLTLGHYAAPLDALVTALKYRQQLGVARELGQRLAGRWLRHREATPSATDPDLLIPVPLAVDRLAQRGFNQAWEIARTLSRQIGVPRHARLIERRVTVASQTRLTVSARWAHTRRAFIAKPRARALLTDMHVGLVDDVMTSGATLDALARVVKQCGARRVTNFVALRTSRD